MFEYEIKAVASPDGKATASANKTEIEFDASSGRDNILPNPAELLLTALAACILKNVERYSEKLKFPYKKAKITVKGIRNDNPPLMKEISYHLEIDTNIETKKLVIWHKNILKFGTITNTLLESTKLNGIITKLNNYKNE